MNEDRNPPGSDETEDGPSGATLPEGAVEGGLDLVDSDLTSDLRGKTVRGGVVLMSSQFFKTLLGILIMGVLARILDPEDYGLIGMVMAMIAVLNYFADMGLSTATVQKEGLTWPQFSNLFWANLMIGVLLTLFSAALAPAIAWFYGEPELLGVTLWCSLGFFLGAVGIQHKALLRRRMQFGRLTVCEIAGLLVGGVVAFSMAMEGYGVYALAGQLLGRLGASTLASWLIVRWLPSLPRRGSGAMSMIKFGGYVTGYNLLNYLARNMDKVLLGRFWGPADLGLYTRAYTLMNFPVIFVSGPFSSAMMPALSRLQNDKERFGSGFLKGLRMIALVSFPAMVFLMFTADDVIEIVFGPKWEGAVPMFRYLCLAGVWQGIYSACGGIYLALGEGRRLFVVGIFISASFVAGFFVGVQWGAVAMSIAYAATFFLILAPFMAYSLSLASLRLGTAARALAPPLIASATMVPVILSIYYLMPQNAPIMVRVFAAGFGSFGAYILVLMLLAPSVLRELIDNLGGAVSFLKRG